MAYSDDVLERFAMQAERLSRETPGFGASVNINDIADAAGIPRPDAAGIARYLQDLGWANVAYAGDAAPLTLTPLGYQEIRKLRRPKWRRWIDQHPLTMNVFWMTVTAIVAGVVYTLIGHYLLK
jgi:hypothetical protein